MPDAIGTLLHEKWLRNCYSGDHADVVLVADGGDGETGYITCRLLRELSECCGRKIGEIGLFAVAADQRCRGVGGHLLRGALA